MKIRTSFVSNSSSSSYCIFGVEVSSSDFQNEDELSTAELLEKILPGSGLIYTDTGDEQYAIGNDPWDDMKNNETKKDFIERVNKNLSKLLGKEVKASYMLGSYY